MLECSDGSYYTGYTNNVDARMKKHCDGKASKYTRSRLPVRLVKKWEFQSKSAAMKGEARFKKLGRKEKMKSIASK